MEPINDKRRESRETFSMTLMKVIGLPEMNQIVRLSEYVNLLNDGFKLER